jgi:hypothetical protein
MFHFKPSLWRDGQLFELPRPVTSVRVQDSWDFARFKVPLGDGDAAVGHSRNGVDIAIEGRCGSQGGQLKLAEDDMFAAIELLRSKLHVPAGSSGYELFLYHDPATSTYRSFRSCSTVRFEYDLSDPHLFSYVVVIHAADPVIRSAPPV